MTKIKHEDKQKIHCIGIGGAGVGAIAEILHAQGHAVSGSDRASSAMTERLQRLGVAVHCEHDAKHIQTPDCVVYSSAISAENPELRTAKAKGIPLLQRAQMLSKIMNQYQGIAISGTHGKTTTSCLVASVLLAGKLDPTFIIGGVMNDLGTNAYLGRGDYLVAEADESDASFLYLSPKMSVINNIEADHMETYDDDFSKLKATFLSFLQRLPEDGLAILNYDDAHVMSLAAQAPCKVFTFGWEPGADYRAVDYRVDGLKSYFQLQRAGADGTVPVVLNLPGKHNVSNALAALVVAEAVGVPLDLALAALRGFAGVGRRFHLRGELAAQGGGTAILIDDYGHHPSEIRATLKTIREVWPTRRVVLAFQPHRYTRTRDLYQEFGEAVALADVVFLTEVYSAGEAALPGVSSALIAAAAQASAALMHHSLFIQVVQNLEALKIQLQAHVRAEDIVLLQGAGDITHLAQVLTFPYP